MENPKGLAVEGSSVIHLILHISKSKTDGINSKKQDKFIYQKKTSFESGKSENRVYLSEISFSQSSHVKLLMKAKF